MAPPAVTVRVDPVGEYMRDGFSTKIAFAVDPNISFWEKTVTPPGIDGGDAIETSTMFNELWRTKSAKALKTMTDASGSVAYDPAVFDQINAIINVEGAITVVFPDNSGVSFFGYLKEFQPQEHQEGEMPLANITIVPTNTDPSDGTEASPVYTADVGT